MFSPETAEIPRPDAPPKSQQDKKDDKAEDEPMSTGLAEPAYAYTPAVAAKDDSQSQIWLVSFTDVMALMLTFFVLLFSMAEPSEKDWSEMTTALQKEFNKFYGAAHYRGLQDSISLDKIDLKEALDLNYVASLLSELISNNEDLEKITLTIQSEELVLTIPGELVFDRQTGGIELQGEGIMYDLGEILARLRNKIDVVAHINGNKTVYDDRFEDSWALSMYRSAEVAAILKNVGYNKNITVRGQVQGAAVLPSDRSSLTRMRGGYVDSIDIVIMEHGDDGDTLFAE